LRYHLKYDHEANRTMWLTCIVKQQIVPYWRIYIKPSKKNIGTRRRLNINLVQQLWLDLNQERIDQVLLISIGYLWKQLDHNKKFSRMNLWKTWSVVWDKMVVEEGLIRTWPWWTMHQRRASESLGIEEPYVMKKDKWIFILRNQAIHEESHITKCQSLLNQDMKWLGDQM
jgi:hypothetical protein